MDNFYLVASEKDKDPAMWAMATEDGGTLMTGGEIMLTGGCKDQALAWALIQHILGDAKEESVLKRTGFFIPVHRKNAERVLDEYASGTFSEEDYRLFFEYFEQAKPYFPLGSSSLYDALLDILTDYYDTELITSAEECAAKMQEWAEIYLQE